MPPSYRKGSGFRYYSGTEAMLRRPHRGNRFNPSPESRLQVAGCWAVDIKTRLAVSYDGFLAEGTKDVSQGGPRDFIVMDDFIYSEPVAE